MDQGTSRVDFANTLRGIAAVCVLIAHYTANFWRLRDAVASLIHAPVLPELFAFPVYLRWLHLTVPEFDWGAFGVALFFLVSGFVIPFSLRNATWQGFLVGRLFRIIPLYMAGFSITILSVWLVGRYFGVSWPFSVGEIAAHYIPGLRELFGMPSIDGIVWTLEIEIKFYLICALAITWFQRGSILVFAVPAALAACEFYMIRNGFGSTALLPIPFLIFMFIGVVFHYLRAGALKPEKALFLGAGLFFLFSILLGEAMPTLASMAWTYGFAVVVFSFAASFPGLFRSTTIGNFFADISYPLYVIHGVAGYAALRVLLDIGAKAWVSLIIVTVGAIGIAWLLHVSVEVPSHNFGRRLATRWRKPVVSQMPGRASVPAE
ncbi:MULTISPECIES: acyltransferase [unclassified Mesorhizobium]|uniref:acyltransferase family protein n=1 Tax=unclassified Mesorhizobium TaxID=325217 RepID=UPI00112DB317|nr:MULTISPECIES: acyltransferase [unclassified Mesorhizobium]TPK42322.1 acyltransferase [Mesorhizobium sp. B2-5-2]TPL44483.1 acyltransferase [Mesorhizobium sp. B2-4-5]TPM68670.1 acyltransferase [Mesorhizobium sp. B2-1-6]TPN71770.1 acyltransferase [Mesorhizobium sp. B1-1-2]